MGLIENARALTGRLEQLERKRRLARRAYQKYEREAFARWSTGVIQRAEKAGVVAPTPQEMTLLKRLAETHGGAFSAPQAVRKGWCGIRSADAATATLDRFVANGWLHRALPNREGQARYSFSQEHVLGQTSAIFWPEGMRGRESLIAADLLAFRSDGSATLDCETTAIPTQEAEGDIWAVARKLAYENGTTLHKIADCIEGLTPIQSAYAMSIAKCRVDGDPVKTHLRGIAEYLSVDYNAFCAGVRIAEAAIRILNEIEMRKAVPNESDNPATPMPTIEI